MRALRLALAPALAACLAMPAPLMAQGGAQPSKAQLERAAENFRVLVSALQSDKVPQAVKGILFTCAYGNSFSQISEGTEKVIGERKLDRKNPTQVLSAMAAVCGFRPEVASPAKK